MITETLPQQNTLQRGELTSGYESVTDDSHTYDVVHIVHDALDLDQHDESHDAASTSLAPLAPATAKVSKTTFSNGACG